MTEFIINSSILILIVIALRHFFKGKISLQLQYALWALVLMRLLVPVSFFSSPISVMNAVKKASAYTYVEKALEDTEIYSDIISYTEMTPDEAREVGKGTLHETKGYASGSVNEHLRTYIFMDSLSAVLERLLKMIWFVGIGAVGSSLLLSNFIFRRKLKKTRKELPADICKLPVYEVETLPSPCLFGLFHPAIYITPYIARDKTRLQHVLAHELTHYRHRDHIWAVLRALCLTVHWYNPLVWQAANLSRRDSELACDEGTIKHIGEASRIEYGRTLIGLTCDKRKAMDLLCCATTMTDEKKGIRERVTLIAKKPKVLMQALIVVILVVAVTVGCTFTGANAKVRESIQLTTQELEQYNKTFEPLLYDEKGNPIGVNPISQFLTSYYNRPEDISISELLRYFPSYSDVTDEAEFEALKAEKNWPFGTDATQGSTPLPIHKFTAETVNETLEEYMGITLNDLSGVGMNALIYLRAYNAYYNFTCDAAFNSLTRRNGMGMDALNYLRAYNAHYNYITSDFGFRSFTCRNGERQGDTVRLFGETATLTLKIQGDGFFIVSHQRWGCDY